MTSTSSPSFNMKSLSHPDGFVSLWTRVVWTCSEAGMVEVVHGIVVVGCCEVDRGDVESAKNGVWSEMVIWVDETSRTGIWSVVVWTWEVVDGDERGGTVGGWDCERWYFEKYHSQFENVKEM